MKTIDRIRAMIPTEQIAESIVESLKQFEKSATPLIGNKSYTFYVMKHMGLVGEETEVKGTFRLNDRAKTFYHNLKQEGYFPQE